MVRRAQRASGTHGIQQPGAQNDCACLPACLSFASYFFSFLPLQNGGFFECDGQLLRDAHIIKDIPGVIVQGE